VHLWFTSVPCVPAHAQGHSTGPRVLFADVSLIWLGVQMGEIHIVPFGNPATSWGGPWLCAPASRRVCLYPGRRHYTWRQGSFKHLQRSRAADSTCGSTPVQPYITWRRGTWITTARSLLARTGRIETEIVVEASRATGRKLPTCRRLAGGFYADCQPLCLEAILVELGEFLMAALHHCLANAVGLLRVLEPVPSAYPDKTVVDGLSSGS
jgi:hypothetical protein